MQETQKTQVWSLDWEDPLEEEMATHSNILAWKIPWTEEPVRLLSPKGLKESNMTAHRAHTLSSVHIAIEENRYWLSVVGMVPHWQATSELSGLK